MKDNYEVDGSYSFEYPANASKLNHPTKERPKFRRRSWRDKKHYELTIAKQRSFSTGEFVPTSLSSKSTPTPLSPKPKLTRNKSKIKILPDVQVTKKTRSYTPPLISPKPQRKQQQVSQEKAPVYIQRTENGNKSSPNYPPLISPKPQRKRQNLQQKQEQAPVDTQRTEKVDAKRTEKVDIQRTEKVDIQRTEKGNKSPPIVSPKPVRRQPAKEYGQSVPQNHEKKIENAKNLELKGKTSRFEGEIKGNKVTRNERDEKFEPIKSKIVRFQEPHGEHVPKENFKPTKKSKTESIRKGMNKFSDSVASVASTATRKMQKKSLEDSTLLIDSDEDTDRMLKEKEERRVKGTRKVENNNPGKDSNEKRKILSTSIQAYEENDRIPTKFSKIGYSPRPKRRLLIENIDYDEVGNMEVDTNKHEMAKNCDQIGGVEFKMLTLTENSEDALNALAHSKSNATAEPSTTQPKSPILDNTSTTSDKKQTSKLTTQTTEPLQNIFICETLNTQSTQGMSTLNETQNTQETLNTKLTPNMATLNETPNTKSTSSMSTLSETSNTKPTSSMSTLNETQNTQETLNTKLTPNMSTLNETPNTKSTPGMSTLSETSNTKPTSSMSTLNETQNTQETLNTKLTPNMSTLNETPNSKSTPGMSTLNETSNTKPTSSMSTLNKTPNAQSTLSMSTLKTQNEHPTQFTSKHSPKVQSSERSSSSPDARSQLRFTQMMPWKKRQPTNTSPNHGKHKSEFEGLNTQGSTQRTPYTSYDDSYTQPTIRKSYSIVTYTPKPSRRKINADGQIMNEKSCAQSRILRSLSLSMEFDNNTKSKNLIQNNVSSIDGDANTKRRHTYSTPSKKNFPSWSKSSLTKKTDKVNLINNSLDEDDSDEDALLNKQLESKSSGMTYQENESNGMAYEEDEYKEPGRTPEKNRTRISFRSAKKYNLKFSSP